MSGLPWADAAPERVRDLEVPSPDGPIRVRMADNGCYWECHWLLPGASEWHEGEYDEAWPPGVQEAYDRAYREAMR